MKEETKLEKENVDAIGFGNVKDIKCFEKAFSRICIGVGFLGAATFYTIHNVLKAAKHYTKGTEFYENINEDRSSLQNFYEELKHK